MPAPMIATSTHRLAFVLARRRPARRRQLQERELVGEARFEGCESDGPVGHS